MAVADRQNSYNCRVGLSLVSAIVTSSINDVERDEQLGDTGGDTHPLNPLIKQRPDNDGKMG